MIGRSASCPKCGVDTTACSLDKDFLPKDCKCLECGYEWNNTLLKRVK